MTSEATLTKTTESTISPGDLLLVEHGVELLQDPAFQEGFIALQTSVEREVLDEVTSNARTEADKLTRNEIDEFAAVELGVSVMDGRKMGKEWGAAIKTARTTVSETTAGATLQDYLFAQHLAVVEADPGFQSWKSEAQTNLAEAQATATAEGAALLADLEVHKDDPAFLEAANVWANSPNSKGDVGEDGKGYNAGIVHFFEYRGDAKKSGRFKVMDEPVSVDGFINYSTRLKADLEAIGSGMDDRDEAVLQDSEGNQRVYILKSDGDMVVAFQRAGESEPRVTSVIPRQKSKDFEKTVADSLGGNDRGKLNKLGETVQRLL